MQIRLTEQERVFMVRPRTGRTLQVAVRLTREEYVRAAPDHERRKRGNVNAPNGNVNTENAANVNARAALAF